MFSQNLKAARKEKGMTLDELANAYNRKYDGKLNKCTLSRYEHGTQEPMLSVAIKLADILDISIERLVK